MTTEQIDARIKKYETERDVLSASHTATCKRFDEIVVQNRTRFAQIQGAIMELTALKAMANGEKEL